MFMGYKTLLHREKKEMPIEDVDYLKRHSIKQSYIFLVDSADRDRSAYPTPSEYTITFTSPFQNVIGLDVVDASIPRTQYNIDANNNTLVFMIHDNSLVDMPIDKNKFTTVAIPPGDYSIQTLIPKLNEALTSTIVNAGGTGSRGSITAEPQSNPPDLTNLIKFTCPYPFVFDMASSTIAESLGFHMYTQESEANKYLLDQRYTNSTLSNERFVKFLKARGFNNIITAKIDSPYSVSSQGTSKFRSLLVGYQVSEFNPSTRTWLVESVKDELIAVSSSKSKNINRALLNITIDGIETYSFPSHHVSPNVVHTPAVIVSFTLTLALLSTTIYPQDVVQDVAQSLLTSSQVSTPKQVYHSVDVLDSDIALGTERTVFEGPRGVIDRIILGEGIVVAQSFNVTSRTYLSGVEAALAGVGSVEWKLYRNTSVPGVYAPGMSVDGAEGTIVIYESDGTLSPSENVQKILLLEGVYWITFRSTNSSLTSASIPSILYNDAVANTQFLKRRQDYPLSPTPWMDVKIGDIVATASIRIVAKDEYHMMVSPGTYNFIGERYIVLRCKEVEEHCYRSLAYSKYFLGLAMFRLGLVGLSDNRQATTSTVNIPIREFHPIGKLAKLTFRFETVKGKLYDFKGVNHTITLALRYLEAEQQETFSKSILNPNYTGNIIEYMYTHEEQEGDSDDQEEQYSRDVLANYRIQEARHLPSAVERLDREALFRARITET